MSETPQPGASHARNLNACREDYIRWLRSFARGRAGEDTPFAEIALLLEFDAKEIDDYFHQTARLAARCRDFEALIGDVISTNTKGELWSLRLLADWFKEWVIRAEKTLK